MAALSGYFAMGGYAAYVWTAFAITAIVLVALLIASLRTFRTQQAALARLEQQTGVVRRRAARDGTVAGAPEIGGGERT